MKKRTYLESLLLSDVGFYVAFLVLVVFFILPQIIYFYYLSPESFFSGLVTELTGFIFDILLFGVLFSVFNHFRNNKLEVRRYKEEIDDYRDWYDLEASYRLAGIIRRLNKYNIHNLELFRCNLEEANLSQLDLSGSDMGEVNLHSVVAINTTFKGVRFDGANLASGHFIESDFRNISVGGSVSSIRRYRKTNFSGSILDHCDFRGAEGITAEHICSAQSIAGIKLDKKIEQNVAKLCPAKFNAPTDYYGDKIVV